MSLLTARQLVHHRRKLLLVACLQAFFTSGIFYGWASLYSLFLDAGVYRDACEPGQHVCGAQKEKLTFIYLVASSVNLVSQLPWGCILDFLGPRVCNLWAGTLVIVGFVLLSLSARGVLDAYAAAMCLIGGAGPGSQISLFHLSELFPMKQKSTVLSVVTGAFQLGFVVFLLFQLAYSHLHISLSNLALLYCIPLVILQLLGGVLWPDQPCIPPDDLDPLSFTSRRPSQPLVLTEDMAESLGSREKEGEGEHRRSLTTSLRRAEPTSGPVSPKWSQRAPQELEAGGAGGALDAYGQREQRVGEEEKEPLTRNVGEWSASPVSQYGSVGGGSPLSRPSSSPERVQFVQQSLRRLRISQSNPNLAGTAASKGFLAQVSNPSYLLCLLWMAICLFWANFFIGTVVEQLWVKSDGSSRTARRYTDIFTLCLPSGVLGIGAFGWLTAELGFSTSIACTSLFGVGYAACALWLPLVWQPLTFVLYSFFRSFLFSVMFAFLANEFGYRHFGLLSGINLAVGGALGFLQYPLARKLVADEKPDASAAAISGAARNQSRGVSPHTVDAFHLVNSLQFYTLLTTFYFAIYVFWRQRMRSKRVEQQIEQHERELASEESATLPA